MSDLIDRDVVIDEIWKLRRQHQMMENTQHADLIMHGLYLAERMIKRLPEEKVIPISWIEKHMKEFECDAYRIKIMLEVYNAERIENESKR